MTNLGSEVLGGRVLVRVVRGDVDIPVDIVLGGGLHNSLDTVDVNISVGEVPAFVSIIHVYIHSITNLVGYWRPTRL